MGECRSKKLLVTERKTNFSSELTKGGIQSLDQAMLKEMETINSVSPQVILYLDNVCFSFFLTSAKGKILCELRFFKL